MVRAFRHFRAIAACLATAISILAVAGSTDESKPRTFDSAREAAGTSLRLLRITPDGEDVPAGRQIVLQFDRAVVPLGRMERDADEVPVEISPHVNCQWRWINTSALACQLSEDNAPRPATRYTVEVRPRFKAKDGATMAAPVTVFTTKSFDTTLPAITRTTYRPGAITCRIPPKPSLQVSSR